LAVATFKRSLHDDAGFVQYGITTVGSNGKHSDLRVGFVIIIYIKGHALGGFYD
jgi:hypothetical protein